MLFHIPRWAMDKFVSSVCMYVTLLSVEEVGEYYQWSINDT